MPEVCQHPGLLSSTIATCRVWNRDIGWRRAVRWQGRVHLGVPRSSSRAAQLFVLASKSPYLEFPLGPGGEKLACRDIKFLRFRAD